MQRCRMSEAERAEVWSRRQRGEPLLTIARVLGRTAAGVRGLVVRLGGVPPRSRRRALWTLTRDERETISRGLAAGLALATIARQLARPTSTVSREVQRHGGRSHYRSEQADARAWARARRPKRCKLARYPRLRRVVAAHLARNWSPEQIAGWLRAHYPDNPQMQVSHETIYLSLFVQTRGVLKRVLLKHLRRPRTMRRPRQPARLNPERIPGAVSIRERPASVDDRAIPGHWEGDLLRGKGRSHIATLVERHSRYVLLVRIARPDTVTVTRALARRIRTLPAHLRQSLTWDRGRELAAHQAFTVATNVQVYFCDPRSPWQRGSNENTNGLLRQYFPPGTDLARLSQATLNAVARQLNTRPRKTLGYQTPAAKLAACVASTA